MLRWEAGGRRGIAAVVTGGGKTVFALACIDRMQPTTSLVVVPTTALLGQWWADAAAYFDLSLDNINVVTRATRLARGTINIAVINTASQIAALQRERECFLVVDECHKAASPQFRAALTIPHSASLGLSATPERQYDDGLQEILIPALGPVIYTYTYRDALRDGVIVPFRLHNIVFELEAETRGEYDKLTKSIARALTQYGAEAPETVGLMLRRARVLNMSLNRVRLALRLVAQHRDRKIIVFHEDIRACELIHHALVDNGIRSGLYHSKLKLRDRAETLTSYRRGQLDVLVTCRALDEGFNVPEAEIGIVAASTATRRQRIQRMGRVLRPSGGKPSAVIYTLVATNPEVRRLKEEEEDLQDVAEVTWSVA